MNAQSEQSPYLADLVKAEEQAQGQGIGMWNKTPGAAEASVRDLPPSGVGEGSTFDALALLDECKGKAIPALVEVGSALPPVVAFTKEHQLCTCLLRSRFVFARLEPLFRICYVDNVGGQ